MLVGLLLACLLAGTLSSMATIPNIPGWYQALAKPVWTPPDWLFAPVWTVLYILMAGAAWLAWRADPKGPEARLALDAFFVQLVLNALWPWTFFALQSPALGLIVIVALLASIVWTMRRFFVVSALAAWLMLPYLLWVMFAAALNGAVLAMN